MICEPKYRLRLLLTRINRFQKEKHGLRNPLAYLTETHYSKVNPTGLSGFFNRVLFSFVFVF